jgi:hypothetical protein
MPICHRTLSRPMLTSERTGEWYAPAEECIGSACALWVPAGRVPKPDRGSVMRYPTEPPPGDPLHGNCADNPFAEPWPNPAAPSGDATGRG